MATDYPPEPKGHPLLGVMKDYTRDRLGFLASAVRDYGDVVQFRFGPFPAVILSNPHDIHQVLVTDAKKYIKPRLSKLILGRFLGDGLITSDGEFWKRQRRLAQPAFHSKRIENYAQVMVEQTCRIINEWGDGQIRSIDHDMMKLTLVIVAKTLFDADVTAAAADVYEAMEIIQETSNAKFNSLIPPLPQWIPTPSNRREVAAIRVLDRVLTNVINQRRNTKEDRGDLLSMLLLAQDEDGAGMTDRQVRNEAMTIFLAGHETTANNLIWTWYLLSQNPDAEARLHDELDTVLGGQVPTLSALQQLPYTAMVIRESMRLYPPAWGFGREAVADVEIGGYTVKKGVPIFILPYLIHRDARWFEQPECFLPERFAAGYEERIPKYSYLPFGGGPRICIGISFAMMEAQLLLAAIASRYRLVLQPGHLVEPEPLITLRAKYGLKMTLQKR